MQNLYVEGSTNVGAQFKDPQLPPRPAANRSLVAGRIYRQGQGTRKHPYPIYMVFGRTRWLDLNADPVTLATTAEMDIPISLFTAQDISFTYPDSMISRLLAEQKDAEYYLPDYHGKLFTLPEMVSIVASQGLPGITWGNNLPPTLANYIEAQVWNQQILFDFMHLPYD